MVEDLEECRPDPCAYRCESEFYDKFHQLVFSSYYEAEHTILDARIYAMGCQEHNWLRQRTLLSMPENAY